MTKLTQADYDKNTSIHTGNVSLKENKMECLFENKIKIELNKVTIDGGLFDSAHKKCDYLVHWHNKNKQSVFYIELKGCDVKKAIQQLINTIELTKMKFASYDEKNCVMVCSRYPKEDSTIRRLKIDLRKKGYVFRPHTRRFTYVVH